MLAQSLLPRAAGCDHEARRSDWRSFLHNAEINAVAVDAKLAARLERQYLDDAARGRAVTLAQWRSRPLRHRIVEWIARRIEFFL